jgi:hypothetical protein
MVVDAKIKHAVVVATVSRTGLHRPPRASRPGTRLSYRPNPVGCTSGAASARRVRRAARLDSVLAARRAAGQGAQLPRGAGASGPDKGPDRRAAVTKRPDSCSESGLDETWYRIPDFWLNDSYVSAAYTQCIQETHETHETGPIRVQIRDPGFSAEKLPSSRGTASMPAGCTTTCGCVTDRPGRRWRWRAKARSALASRLRDRRRWRVLFGGATSTSTFRSLVDETWLLSDGAWSLLSGPGPSALGLPALGFDIDREVYVLRGGSTPMARSSPTPGSGTAPGAAPPAAAPDTRRRRGSYEPRRSVRPPSSGAAVMA